MQKTLVKPEKPIKDAKATKPKSKPRKKKVIKENLVLPVLMIKSLLLGIFLICALMAVVAGVMMLTDLPMNAVDGASMVAIIFGSVVASCWASSNHRRHGLFLGIGVGFAIYLVLFLVSLLFGPQFGIIAITKLMICILSGAIGGIYGVNIRKVNRI